MPWSERQAAMLAEMGVRLWLPPAAAPVAAVPGSTSPRGDAAAPQAPAPAPSDRPPTGIRGAAPVRPAAPLPSMAVPTDRPPRPAGVEQMDWPALRQAVAECQACGLCRGRRQSVFGVGHERAHWMLVGEAPGEQEDLQGEPFVGKAGQLLDRMLASIGLNRQVASDADPAAAARQVFIANVLKCRPPNNRNPEPQEVAQCEPYLKRQVELVRPRIILAMGRFAVQSLLQTQEPIGRLRGRVHRYHGVPVIVTYHPAYLLRNLLDKARSWEDLCLAASVAEAAAREAGD